MRPLEQEIEEVPRGAAEHVLLTAFKHIHRLWIGWYKQFERLTFMLSVN